MMGLAMPALLAGCAAPLTRQALGMPGEEIAATGFATLQSASGLRGAAVAFDDTLALTCAHLLPAQPGPLLLRRGDGLREAPAELLARSPRMDLAVLRIPAGLLRAPPRAVAAPRSGAPVWAAGAPSLGPGIAQGHVEAPDAEMPGFGRGFTARMPVLMGYSGGPVVDASGHLLGLTSALPQPGAAGLLALLSGADLDGLAGGDRQVFVLDIRRAAIEARRLLASA